MAKKATEFQVLIGRPIQHGDVLVDGFGNGHEVVEQTPTGPKTVNKDGKTWNFSNHSELFVDIIIPEGN